MNFVSDAQLERIVAKSVSCLNDLKRSSVRNKTSLESSEYFTNAHRVQKNALLPHQTPNHQIGAHFLGKSRGLEESQINSLLPDRLRFVDIGGRTVLPSQLDGAVASNILVQHGSEHSAALNS